MKTYYWILKSDYKKDSIIKKKKKDLKFNQKN